MSLCPALLQQAVEGCTDTEAHTDDTSDELTDAEGTTLNIKNVNLIVQSYINRKYTSNAALCGKSQNNTD